MYASATGLKCRFQFSKLSDVVGVVLACQVAGRRRKTTTRLSAITMTTPSGRRADGSVAMASEEQLVKNRSTNAIPRSSIPISRHKNTDCHGRISVSVHSFRLLRIAKRNRIGMPSVGLLLFFFLFVVVTGGPSRGSGCRRNAFLTAFIVCVQRDDCGCWIVRDSDEAEIIRIRQRLWLQ